MAAQRPGINKNYATSSDLFPETILAVEHIECIDSHSINQRLFFTTIGRRASSEDLGARDMPRTGWGGCLRTFLEAIIAATSRGAQSGYLAASG